MKTIIYSLIAIFVFGIFAPDFTNKSNKKHNLLIQSTENNISIDKLNQSNKIISNRLKSFGIEKFDVISFPDKNQIQVTLASNYNIELIKDLIIQKGKLEFYETYNYKSLKGLLKNDSILLSLLQVEAPLESSVKIACTSSTQKEKVDTYLNSLDLNSRCKFVWSNLFNSSNNCLYALKTSNGNGVVFSGDNIESFKHYFDEVNNMDYIEFKTKKSAIKQWSQLTKRNINKSIAIVLDNAMIYAPMVKTEIKGGNGQITGDFTKNQVKYITTIGNNGVLPLSFNIIE